MSNRDGRLSRRQMRALILVGMILGAVAVPALAAVFSNPIPQSGTIPYQSNAGPTVYFTGNVNTSSGTPFPDDTTVDLNTSEGNITFSSSSSTQANITASNITGTYTTVTGIDATGATLTIDPEDKPAVDVAGDLDRIKFREAAIDDGTVDFVYAGTSGTSTITVRGLAANTQVGAVDVDSNTVLDAGTTDGSGTVTFTVPNSEHRVELVTSDGAPVVSNPSPTGDLDHEPTSLSVDINDSDFPNDNVTVTFYLDGSQVGQKSTTTNGTVSTSISSPTGGSHDWTVEATDEYDQTTTKSYSFNVPDTLYIRNESDPGQLVDSPIEVTVRFFAGDTVETRTTTDGTLNLTGLPVNDVMTITVEASENYTARTVTISDIFEQQSVFLLPDSKTTVSPTFILDDKTGRFPASDTRIQLQKPINRSQYSGGGTGTQWTTIEGDFFDASQQFEATLEQGQRYRIVVINSQGDSRVLGHYTATSSDSVTLPVGRVSIDGDGPTTWAFRSSIIEENGQKYIKVVYRDLEEQTDTLKFNVTRRGDSSTVIQPNTTVSGPVRTHVELIPISDPENNKSYTVNFWVDRDSSTDLEISNQRYVGRVPDIANRWNIDQRWLEVIGWVTVVSFTGLVVIVNGRLAAIVGVSTATMLTWLGVISLPIPALGLAGAGAVIFAVAGGRT